MIGHYWFLGLLFLGCDPVKASSVCPCGTFPRPQHEKLAERARWLVSASDWGLLTTTSSEGIPRSNVYSFADAECEDSSGLLYFYSSPLDFSMVDWSQSPNAPVSFTLSEAMMDCPDVACSRNPMDPPCTRLIVAGRMRKCLEEEVATARAAVFSKHPDEEGWPANHNFTFFTIDIEEVEILDWYGGGKNVDLEEYWNATLVKQALPLQAHV